MTPPARILVTGATGAVGGAVMRRLTATGYEAYGVSSRGGSSPRQFAWRIGTEEPPDPLHVPWHTVVHCAADTCWNLSAEESEQSNVAPLRALLKWMDESTRLIHLSSSYATGLTGSVEPTSSDAYRNMYEWSKAAAPSGDRRRALDGGHRPLPHRDGCAREDGFLDRYSGFFWLPSSLCTGAVPALVGDAEA
ncbi:NAD(P)-dependent oxidoreductase [Streptomyces libani]